MVRSLALAAALLAAQAQAQAPASPDAIQSPRALSATPTPQDLPLLPDRPQRPKLQNPSRWEYITVVTLLSAPFTVLWYGLAVGAVESVAQRGNHLLLVPPKFNSGLYAGVGAAALGTSLGIALFSVSWGRQGQKEDGSPRSLSPSASGVRALSAPAPEKSGAPAVPGHG